MGIDPALDVTEQRKEGELSRGIKRTTESNISKKEQIARLCSERRESTLARDLSSRLEDIQETLSSKIGGCEIFSLSLPTSQPRSYPTGSSRRQSVANSVWSPRPVSKLWEKRGTIFCDRCQTTELPELQESGLNPRETILRPLRDRWVEGVFVRERERERDDNSAWPLNWCRCPRPLPLPYVSA